MPTNQNKEKIMEVDESKVIRNPETLPDGEYYFGDSIGNMFTICASCGKELCGEVTNDILKTYCGGTNTLSYWNFYYPKEKTK